MDKQPFKSINMKQLEEAFAAAIKAITTSETGVAVLMIKDVSTPSDGYAGQQRYEVALALTVATVYDKSDLLPHED